METETKGYNLTINVHDFTISYDDVGEGSIPVIFLHGYPFDKTMWQVQLEFLKTTRRVIACDIRGFGKSTDEKSELSIDVFADDLIMFIDKLELDKVIVCGLCMGGFIALNAMKRFPSRFAALILCDTACMADTPEVTENRSKNIAEIKAAGVTNFNEGFINSVFHKNTITNNLKMVDQLRRVVFSNSQHIISQGMVAVGGRSETCSTLSEINIPTLIICGREDLLTPLAQSEFMKKNIKGSILRIIDNAGHVSNLEKPNEFNVYLGEFLTT